MDDLSPKTSQYSVNARTVSQSKQDDATFAPKYASSQASLYETNGTTIASFTTRGSAEYTPETSVQMVHSLADSNLAKMDAE
jgi:hypothetical protein